jgi:CBS domain-containing protein
MLIGPLAQRQILTVGADVTLTGVARQMWARRVGSAVVHVPEGKPGIITERDVLHASPTGAIRARPRSAAT